MDVFANTILPETMSHFYLLHLDYKFKPQKKEQTGSLFFSPSIFHLFLDGRRNFAFFHLMSGEKIRRQTQDHRNEQKQERAQIVHICPHKNRDDQQHRRQDKTCPFCIFSGGNDPFHKHHQHKKRKCAAQII